MVAMNNTHGSRWSALLIMALVFMAALPIVLMVRSADASLDTELAASLAVAILLAMAVSFKAGMMIAYHRSR